MRCGWIAICLWPFLWALAFSRPVFADGMPTQKQALLLLRILAYDHNLGSRADNKTVTIVVVSKTGNSESEDTASELISVIRDIAKTTTLANNAIRVSRLAFSDKTFDADVEQIKAAALYVAPGLADNLGTITATTQNRKILSFAGSTNYVASGVSVGFALEEGHSQILLNLPASRREGADLDFALLKVAKIVKK
jgi:hypothetical protein